jgi:hypothetical protein
LIGVVVWRRILRLRVPTPINRHGEAVRGAGLGRCLPAAVAPRRVRAQVPTDFPGIGGWAAGVAGLLFAGRRAAVASARDG